jgi:hypothetical protein
MSARWRSRNELLGPFDGASEIGSRGAERRVRVRCQRGEVGGRAQPAIAQPVQRGRRDRGAAGSCDRAGGRLAQRVTETQDRAHRCIVGRARQRQDARVNEPGGVADAGGAASRAAARFAPGGVDRSPQAPIATAATSARAIPPRLLRRSWRPVT